MKTKNSFGELRICLVSQAISTLCFFCLPNTGAVHGIPLKETTASLWNIEIAQKERSNHISGTDAQLNGTIQGQSVAMCYWAAAIYKQRCTQIHYTNTMNREQCIVVTDVFIEHVFIGLYVYSIPLVEWKIHVSNYCFDLRPRGYNITCILSLIFPIHLCSIYLVSHYTDHYILAGGWVEEPACS